MSPAPSRTSVDAIVAAARRILETDGLAAVTMRSVAEAVGVQGPSLYKRVPDRAALVRAVADGVVADLAGTLARATETVIRTPTCDRWPLPTATSSTGTRMAIACCSPTCRPGPPAIPLRWPRWPIRSSGRWRRWPASPTALEGARTFVAWAHGFVTMELAGAFRLGGDLDAAYAFGIESILAGVRSRATPASRSG